MKVSHHTLSRASATSELARLPRLTGSGRPRSESALAALVGPTGAGKTSLARILQWAGVRRIATTTTRAARTGEVPGRDLHVITPARFCALRAANELIAVCEYSSASYGVQVQHLREAAASALAHVIIVEPSGVPALKSWAFEAGLRFAAVFVTASVDSIQKRLEERYASENGTAKEREDRMRRVQREIHDWPGAYAWDIALDGGEIVRDAQAVLDLIGASTAPVSDAFECA